MEEYRRVRWLCCWENVWRELMTVKAELGECVMYWIGRW